ncbi:hypothetical protein [Aquimarina litoralis]|uniref:hypothetical protein n=1 Tax=Aquimarina litoralis TaxID=584605 RepID=UPI001C583359|nr:hypothetical protein [Aquimarina litoralis]MBW1294301.1 hypothetical protein [Aquimarina litoralis]
MAPLKFEDNIREKLEQRTIQPSKTVWEQLDQELDAQNGQKKIKRYWWIGVAASVAGFLIIATLYMNTSNEIIPSNNHLVETTTEKEDNSELEENNEVLKTKPETQVVANEKIIKTQEKVIKTPIKEKKQVALEKTKIAPNNAIASSDKITQAEEVSSEIIEETKAIKSSVVSSDPVRGIEKPLEIDKAVIQNKISDIVAQVQQLEQNNRKVTDEEIDALLKNAQLEITTQQILQSNKVNASALLLDVESELDESFKDRVFEALKTGFEKLKTTVAERDN